MDIGTGNLATLGMHFSNEDSAREGGRVRVLHMLSVTAKNLRGALRSNVRPNDG
jgi:hypothetical protein